MGKMESKLVVKLIDDVSGPASRASGALNKLDKAARSVKGGRVSDRLAGTDIPRYPARSPSTRERAAAALAGVPLRTGAVVAGGAAVGAAVAGGAAFKEWAEIERRISRIALTADATRTEGEDALRRVRDMAQQTATPVEKVVEGLESLVATGKGLGEALSLLPSISRTAQASGAEVSDMATTAVAVSEHLKVGAGEMQKAFDLMVAGGKSGKFELRDMARYLPSIAPMAAAVGLQGAEGLKRLVAILQVVRSGTGTTEEAAASVSNIFAKMESEETVKRFKKFGIDLRKEMEKARKEGKDLLTVFVELSEKATKGDLSKIPQLFSDMEFARGMRALLAQKDAVDKLVAALANVDGSTLQDLARILADAKSQTDRLSNAWAAFVQTMGQGLDTAGVTTAIENTTSAIQRLQQALADREGGLLKDSGFAAQIKYMFSGGGLLTLLDELDGLVKKMDGSGKGATERAADAIFGRKLLEVEDEAEQRRRDNVRAHSATPRSDEADRARAVKELRETTEGPAHKRLRRAAAEADAEALDQRIREAEAAGRGGWQTEPLKRRLEELREWLDVNQPKKLPPSEGYAPTPPPLPAHDAGTPDQAAPIQGGAVPMPAPRPDVPIPVPRPEKLSEAGREAGRAFTEALEQELQRAQQAAASAGARIREALSVTARPTVDTSGIQSAVNLAQRVRRLNADFGPAPA